MIRFEQPKFWIENKANLDPVADMKHMERVGRRSHKSEDKITEYSYKKFLERIVKMQHWGILEHVSVSISFFVDRGISHEIVRHRQCSFVQESTRYVDYSGREILYIIPPGSNLYVGSVNTLSDVCGENMDLLFIRDCLSNARQYLEARDSGLTPQIARGRLNHHVATEITVTANLRVWRELLQKRIVAAAHPQMRQVMIPVYRKLYSLYSPLFTDMQACLNGTTPLAKEKLGTQND